MNQERINAILIDHLEKENEQLKKALASALTLVADNTRWTWDPKITLGISGGLLEVVDFKPAPNNQFAVEVTVKVRDA